MNTKILTILKYITFSLIVFASLISCEKDFENVGGDLVDNGVFSTNKQDFELISYSKNIEASRVDNIGYLGTGTKLGTTFGVYRTQAFGILNASVVAQVLLPATTVDWGTSPKLDAVYVEIPYVATRKANAEDGKPQFSLDNIYGNVAADFQVEISRLDTYLNLLDPADPSKKNKYYSNDTFTASTVLHPSSNFKPRATDTVLKFDRELLEVASPQNPITVKDTIKRADVSPFIRFKLDKEFFRTNFIENPDQTQFENADNFVDFFRGLLFKVTGNDGAVLSLDFTEASLKLYYTNEVEETGNETTMVVDGVTGVDLNGDGDKDDTEVTYRVRKKKVMVFPIYNASRGIRTNTFTRNYSGFDAETALVNPNTTDGEKTLYIQGAQGSTAVLDLFKDVDLTELRNKDWLITEASLTFYIDQTASGTDVPEKLLLYKLDPDETNNINENEQISDAVKETPYFGGFLEKDGDTPVKYKINITDYISNVLKQEDFVTPVKLGLKPYYFTDVLPTGRAVTASELIVKDYSWDPKGVVIYGNNYVEGDTDYNKRLRLEIHYTKTNQ